jgi:RimJ/RimL family protein N-acetyltransferase
MSDPILLDLPSHVETPRLLLRIPQAGDGPAHLDAVSESLPELKLFLSFLPWVANEPTLESFEVRCRTDQANFFARKNLVFLMFEKSSGQLLGSVGLYRTNWETPKTEVGYWCRTSRSGNGFAREAVAALTDYAFSHIHAARVELITDSENLASRRVAERCGFSLEGILHNEFRAPNNSLRHTCVYARVPSAP